jgi:hypothetical protein
MSGFPTGIWMPEVCLQEDAVTFCWYYKSLRHGPTMTHPRSHSRWSISFPRVKTNVLGPGKENAVTHPLPSDLYTVYNTSEDSSVSIVNRLGAGRPGSSGSFSTGARNFFLLHSVQTGCGLHLAFYPKRVGLFTLGVKRPGREADRLQVSNIEVKNAWCLIMHMDNLTSICTIGQYI